MTSAVAVSEHVAADVRDTPVDHYWEEYQYVYAIYTLGSRAIPSALDGLKPVQRRLLYQMHLNKLIPGAKPSKSSKVCSAVSGNLHPHGDVSVYGAAALLAAHFQRTRLVDGQGSFPRVQGDIPASARYTEMRLSSEGYELVRELTEHSVNMVPSFDGELLEPTVLPSRFPVLLVNGAVGIAEAYSTKVPAHNPRAVLALAKAMLEDPKLDTDAIVDIIGGPDWGSGGVIVGTDGIREYIETGKGRMIVRGSVSVEGKDIIVSALPPGVSSSGFQEKVRAGLANGTIEGVSDFTDLTDRRNGLRILITVKRGHTPEDVLKSLYTYTPLEDTFAASLVALDEDRVPRWWTVPELILSFLELRDSVVLKRSQHRLEKASARLHLVKGLVTIQADIDKAVSIIRQASNAAAARTGLEQHFGIDEVQADHVLSMQLRRLTSQDVLELKTEAESLEKEITKLTRLVESRAARRKEIARDLDETAKLFDDPSYDRKTVIDREAVASTRSEDGGESGVSDKWCLNDHGVFGTEGTPINKGIGWAVFTDGRVKTTDGKGLPRPGRDVLVAPDISALLVSGVAEEGRDLVLVTRRAKVIRLELGTINPQGVAGNGVAGVKLADPDDQVIAAFTVKDEGAVLSITDGRWKVTSVADIPRKGRGGQGVGFHLFVKGEDALLAAHYSDTGFEVSGKPVKAETRAKSAVKGTADWKPVGA